MIRTLVTLIPADRRGKVWCYAILTLLSVAVRALRSVIG